MLTLIEGGKVRAGEYVDCPMCNSQFVRRAKVPQGKVKKICCSRACYSQYRARHKAIINCASCQKEFPKKRSELKNSVSGLYFCSIECKNKEHKMGGLIAPDHYGTATTGGDLYWKVASENNIVECVVCKLNFKALLVVHHIDGCRENNEAENLEFLCHTHHALRHMKIKKGKWVYDTKSLTPRDKFDEILEGSTQGELEPVAAPLSVQKDSIEFKCIVCDIKIYRSNWDIKVSKTGFFCCSLECKNTAQRGKIDIPGIEKLAHRVIHGNSRYNYIKNEYNACCADCGLNYSPWLVVHHKDSNRENGSPDNLEVLCFNHHVVRHMHSDANGNFVFAPSSLSSPDTIKAVNDLIKKTGS